MKSLENCLFHVQWTIHILVDMQSLVGLQQESHLKKIIFFLFRHCTLQRVGGLTVSKNVEAFFDTSIKLLNSLKKNYFCLPPFSKVFFFKWTLSFQKKCMSPSIKKHLIPHPFFSLFYVIGATNRKPIKSSKIFASKWLNLGSGNFYRLYTRPLPHIK